MDDRIFKYRVEGRLPGESRAHIEFFAKTKLQAERYRDGLRSGREWLEIVQRG